MKNLSLIFIIVLFLSSCAPATIEPTVAVTQSPTIIPSSTLKPTSTPKPTLTPIPTATVTPSLPETIEFKFDKKIPENFIGLVKTTVNQAYWFYRNMGCSPEFHHVGIVSHESALTVGFDGILVGWDDLKSISTNMDVRISHEMFHVMCQLAIKQDPNTGLELMWLLEGMANYYSGVERLTNTGMLSGWKGKVADHEVGMGEWVIQSNFCNYPFSSVEKDIKPINTGALGIRFPDFGGVGEVAATLLAKTSINGTEALINYYKFLVNDPSDIAFQKAFGKTKSEFYQQFQEDCSKGFPTLKK